MDKQKILHIITKGGPFGGAQKYVFEIVTHLPNDRFESVVATGRGNDLPQAIHRYNTENGAINIKAAKNNPISIVRLPSLGRDISLINDARSFIDIVNLIKKESPDIVHLHSSKIGGIGALAVRWVCFIDSFKARPNRPIRSIFTAHGWPSNESRLWIIRKIFLITQWITVLLTDKTIAVSEKTRQDMLSLPGMDKKIITIHTGIAAFSTLSREAARLELSHKYAIPPDTLWIGTLSELHKNKGIDLAIEALSKIAAEKNNSNFSYIIFGGGGDEYGKEKEKLMEQISSLNLTEKVFLLGPVPNAKKYLKALDVFSLTSRTEALPFALLEAGSAGLPCIATYVGGIPEIIRNNVSGILVEPEVSYIQKGFTTIISDVQKSTLYGQNIKEKVDTFFSLNAMLEKITVVYRQSHSLLSRDVLPDHDDAHSSVYPGQEILSPNDFHHNS